VVAGGFVEELSSVSVRPACWAVSSIMFMSTDRNAVRCRDAPDGG
jgi:hypothetical protein